MCYAVVLINQCTLKALKSPHGQRPGWTVLLNAIHNVVHQVYDDIMLVHREHNASMCQSTMHKLLQGRQFRAFDGGKSAHLHK